MHNEVNLVFNFAMNAGVESGCFVFIEGLYILVLFVARLCLSGAINSLFIFISSVNSNGS